MSKLKTFKLELTNPKTEETEELIVRKFTSVEDLYNTADLAEKMEAEGITMKAQLDLALNFVLDLFKSEGLTRKRALSEIDSADFFPLIQELMGTMTGTDPKMQPPVKVN